MIERAERQVERVTRLPPVALALGVLDVYGRAAGGILANGLAFSALFAAVPTMLLVLSALGFLLDDPAYQERLIELLGDVLPPLRDLLDEILVSVTGGAAITSVVALAGLVWAVSQFYVTLDTAFARLFPGTSERNVVHRTARGFAWVVVLVALVVGLVVVAATASLVAAVVPDAFSGAGSIRAVLASPIVQGALASVVIAVAYRVLPPRTPTLRALAPPAIAVGVVVVVLTQIFAILAPRLVGSAALVGSLATAFIALAWLSFSFQAILIGAAWVAVRMGFHVLPEAAAGAGAGAAPTSDGDAGEP